MIPLLPVAVAGLAALAYYKAGKKETTVHGENEKSLFGVVTPEREFIYKKVMTDIKLPPEKIRELAQEFRKAGLEPHAALLEKRAEVRSLPKELYDARKDAFRKAMKSTNIPVIRHMADAYEQEACFGAAQKLRERAAALEALSRNGGEAA